MQERSDSTHVLPDTRALLMETAKVSFGVRIDWDRRDVRGKRGSHWLSPGQAWLHQYPCIVSLTK